MIAVMRGGAAADLKELTAEYNRLFVGPNPPPCPPYESVYDQHRPPDQEGTVMGPAAEAMLQALWNEGYRILGR